MKWRRLQQPHPPPFDYRPLRLFFAAVALLFAWGGVVHAGNMLSLNGFHWSTAPLAWKIFDVVFLVLNGLVVAGLVLRRWWGVAAFMAAAGLQLILYTLFAEHFAVNAEQEAAIRGLLVLQAALLILFAGLMILRARQAPIAPSS